MFGHEANLPVDLTFGTSFTDSVSPDQYARKVQNILCYTYSLAHELLAESQK